jgi:5-methylcytosine-specific restriction protein A
VTRLSDLSIAAVAAAITEFQDIGREAFIAKYRFGASRDYFLVHENLLVDTKPVIAAAYAIRHPDRAPLKPHDFSGGAAGAAAVLKRMGFRVGTRAELYPPRLGAEFASRREVCEAYGGNKAARIVRFPGESVVNVFSDADGAYADDPPALTVPFGCRGEGQRVHAGGNLLLESARVNGEAVRYWYRPQGGKFTFLTWVVVSGRSWVAGVEAEGLSRPELDWQLDRVPGPATDEWPPEVAAALQDAAFSTEDDANVPEATSTPTYGELIDRIERRGQSRRPTGVVRTDYARSAAARRAVLIRSEGRCEAQSCTGMPSELNRRGEPILDVDHVQDLARGGEDHPRNMVALCPNCHAVKTRGANQAQWRRSLRVQAQTAHAAMRL